MCRRRRVPAAAVRPSSTVTPSDRDDRQRLRLLTFNIAAGTATGRYREYLTHSWRQVLPYSERTENLEAAASLVADYDVVGLQETDSGSLRSGYINQTKFLARHADFPYWSHQSNRKVGTLAYPGNGFLSRFKPSSVTEHRLPGAIPGRGALWMDLGEGDGALSVVVLHLALGRRARMQQLQFIARELETQPRAVVLGDMNTVLSSPEMQDFVTRTGYQVPEGALHTYPSWQPQRAIDHILVSPGLEIESARVVPANCSDHCALAVDLRLPADLKLHSVDKFAQPQVV